MNQAFIINDDLTYLVQERVWQVTGILSGQCLTFRVPIKKVNNESVLSQALKFDIECLIENWLDEHEPEIELVEL
ncbi:hypothetical protein [Algibacillus agarilyticus]|uniref:hypothetical protein n=1 Tax=Algibacillus agarilyticus TaxID=2234133 RepID=UPI000DD05F8D|nr:hypothetical protein [Algibacillus agarilyticus]